MRHFALVSAFVMSISALAMRAPKGEYIALSCSSVGAKEKFKVKVLDNAKAVPMKLVLERADGTEKVYEPVHRQVSNRIGGGVTYSAPAAGGRIALSINNTTSPRPGGVRPATLIASAFGRVTKTELSCSHVMH